MIVIVAVAGVVNGKIILWKIVISLAPSILAASIRHVDHVKTSALYGSDTATIPFNVLNQLFNHPLTDIGIEKFLADHKKAQ